MTRANWEERPLGDYVDLVKGLTYSSSDYSDEIHHRKFITLKCVSKTGGFNAAGIKYFNGIVDLRAVVKTGDLIIANTDLTRDGDIVGCPILVPENIGKEEPIISMDLSRLEIKRDAPVDKKYLYYQLMTDKARFFMRDHSGGSTVLHLKTSAVGKLMLPFPDLKLQRIITEILSTIDRALEQTRALIAKYQRIKTGLMQDLLTRGIDEHGRLRHPDTHEFKDSRLGRIPVEWEVKNLGSLLLETPKNGIYKAAKDIGSGSLIIGQLAIDSEEKIDYSQARRAKISPSELNAYGLRNGDLLITRVFATPEGVGRSVLIEKIPEPAVYESNMMRVRVNQAQIKPYFLFHWFKTHLVRRYIESSLNASNQSSINQVSLNAVPCVIPSTSEQDAIIDRCEEIETLIRVESANLEKHKKFKTGLMQDLLSGKKTVESLLHEFAALVSASATLEPQHT